MFIWIVSAIEIWSCFYNPDFSQQKSLNHLNTPNANVYTIKLEEGFPAFYIVSPSDTSDEVFNDETLFDYYFLASTESTNTTVAAKPCDEVIPKYVADETLQKEILSEFNTQHD